MAKGKVKNVTGKGFGFIQTDESEKDVFYHERSLQGNLSLRKLRMGDEVIFDLKKNEKGYNAVNIKLVDGDET